MLTQTVLVSQAYDLFVRQYTRYGALLKAAEASLLASTYQDFIDEEPSEFHQLVPFCEPEKLDITMQAFVRFRIEGGVDSRTLKVEFDKKVSGRLLILPLTQAIKLNRLMGGRDAIIPDSLLWQAAQNAQTETILSAELSEFLAGLPFVDFGGQKEQNINYGDETKKLTLRWLEKASLLLLPM